MAERAGQHGGVDPARRRSRDDIDDDAQLDIAADVPQQLEINLFGVVFRTARIGMAEERCLRALRAISDRVQEARGAHKLQDFLAYAVHIDGERKAAETNQRDAQFLLAQMSEPLNRQCPVGYSIAAKRREAPPFGYSIVLAVSIHSGWRPSASSAWKISSPWAWSRVSMVTSSLAPLAGTSRKSRR